MINFTATASEGERYTLEEHDPLTQIHLNVSGKCVWGVSDYLLWRWELRP